MNERGPQRCGEGGTEKSRHNMPDNGRKESRIVSGITTKKGSRKDAREMHREDRKDAGSGCRIASGGMDIEGMRGEENEKKRTKTLRRCT